MALLHRRTVALAVLVQLERQVALAALLPEQMVKQVLVALVAEEALLLLELGRVQALLAMEAPEGLATQLMILMPRMDPAVVVEVVVSMVLRQMLVFLEEQVVYTAAVVAVVAEEMVFLLH